MMLTVISNRPSTVFSQQRKLMGSSAQNSSGVHWCRRRVRFNGRFREALVQTSGQVQQGSGKGSGEGLRLWCRARSGSTGFRRRFWRRSGRLGCRHRVRFNRVRRRFWRRSGRLWCRARSGSTRFQRRFRRRSGRVWCRARSG